MKIYHKRHPTFQHVDGPFDPREFDLVDVLPITDLDEAYSLTQNIDEAWRQPPCRSSSVGDVFVTADGSAFAVCGVGFEQVELGGAEHDASLIKLGEAIGAIDTNVSVEA